MAFLAAILLAVIVVGTMVWFYIWRQGDAELVFLVDKRTEFVVQELAADRVVLTSEIPFINKGTQDGTVMDVFLRPLLPREYYDGVTVEAQVTLMSQPRTDNYWESVIICYGKGDVIKASITLIAKNSDIATALQDMVDMPINIITQVVARSDSYLQLTQFVMPSAEVITAVAAKKEGQRHD